MPESPLLGGIAAKHSIIYIHEHLITSNHLADFNRILKKDYFSARYPRIARNHGCMFIYLFVCFSVIFFLGRSYRPSGPRMSRNGSF